jgi:hypothetical protein
LAAKAKLAGTDADFNAVTLQPLFADEDKAVRLLIVDERRRVDGRMRPAKRSAMLSPSCALSVVDARKIPPALVP